METKSDEITNAIKTVYEGSLFQGSCSDSISFFLKKREKLKKLEAKEL